MAPLSGLDPIRRRPSQVAPLQGLGKANSLAVRFARVQIGLDGDYYLRGLLARSQRVHPYRARAAPQSASPAEAD